MKHWIRRTFTLSVLAVSTAMSFAVMAQPLPLPKPPVVILELRIKVVVPEPGVKVAMANKFVWESELLPDKYVLKFKRADGTILKYTVPMEQCTPEGKCSVKLADTGVLDTAKNGDIIKWRVIAVHGDETTKTDMSTFIANTVDAPELINPMNGAQFDVEDELRWTNSIANEKYMLIVRDMEGALIIRRAIAAESCTAVCEYDPLAAEVLERQTEYQWFVKAKGYNGDKAKSSKQLFVTGNWPSAVMK